MIIFNFICKNSENLSCWTLTFPEEAKLVTSFSCFSCHIVNKYPICGMFSGIFLYFLFVINYL